MARIRGNRFQADVAIDGVRHRRSFKTLQEAEEFERDAGKGLISPKEPAFKQFHRAHFEYLWGDNKAPEAARMCLAALDRYIYAWMPITEINRVYVFDLISRMKKEGISNATINRRLSHLSKLLRHAEDLDLMKRPHIKFLKEPHGRERVLSPVEEQLMERFFKHHGLRTAWAAASFLLYTGCRLGEIYGLHRSDVEDGRVTFSYTITKSTKTRVVPLVGPAQDAWEFTCDHSDEGYPFRCYPRGTFREHWNRFRDHMRLTNDPQFVPHMLRHTCASRLVSKGIPLPKVMLWMGHSSIQTTLRYSHLTPKELDEAALALAKYL
jgi:integrase